MVLASSGSDVEELLESPERSRSRMPFSTRIALALAGVGLVATALLLLQRHQASSTGLHSRMHVFLGLDETCIKKGMFYSDPHKMDGTSRTVETSIEACQQRCGNTAGCAHFTYWPDGGCMVTDASSMARAAPYQYSDIVSGPPWCGGRPGVDGILFGAEAAVGSDIYSGSKTREVMAPPPGVNGTTCSAYPACVHVGISQGNCCPNDDKVTLGCCKGFQPPMVKALPITLGAECTLFPGCANVTGSCCPAADGTRLACCDAPLMPLI